MENSCYQKEKLQMAPEPPQPIMLRMSINRKAAWMTGLTHPVRLGLVLQFTWQVQLCRQRTDEEMTFEGSSGVWELCVETLLDIGNRASKIIVQV